MEYWRNAVDNVTIWAFLKFKFSDTRNLNQEGVENVFGANRFHCGSNNNKPDVLNTVIIKCLAYKSVYGTNCEEGGACLLDKLLSFLSHPMLHEPVHRKVITVRPLTVF